MISLIAVLGGCGTVPFIEYEHLSDSRVSGDGYDLLCAGGITEIASVEVSLAPCKNVSGYGGEYIKINVRKVFDR